MDFLVNETLKQYHHETGEIPFSTKPTRKRFTGPRDIEVTSTRKRASSVGSVNYLKKNRFKKKIDFKKHLRRLPWYVLGVLILRLFFMDRGVIDYYQTENRLLSIQHELELGKQEIKEIEEEIYLIKNNKPYQKKLARDHLGVIGPDEYLVLFAQESTHPSK